MKIFNCSNAEIKEQKLLIEALKIDINKKKIISFVGGGGKTSLIYELGNELSKLGKKVIVTTTTHMCMPKSNVVLTGKKDDIKKLLYSKNMITVGMLCDQKDKKFEENKLKNKQTVNCNEEEKLKKISGLTKEMATSLIELADFVLVEADGSKRLPLKVPAQHEPVILEGSNLVVGVCGIDAIGKSIDETCHRSNLVSKFLDTDEQHIINETDIAKILLSENGQKKDVKCDYRVVVNKIDTREEFEIAKNISHEFLKLGVNELILTTFREEAISK
ncbi:selenium cofactor biosynthesis protein YqeC [Clostridium uliginosum]|uniref:Probable selenium-dependent hydroxylase accessory protein YqeC n=1 Tax=Clostridium uliginosum TaxID=119641 RepID=A0A1I1RH42_9CLOT|nr:selenium cofactor biosynthesis protein YqeC [Clostridium uliginosum]SFD30903.1 probable selenium-dependent hydroxylase accessory protein YqeC [Clostridium uliginosum]